jgi:NDP-sugar pyrophosphorylase family protein
MELIFVSTPDDLQTYSALNRFLNDKDVQENLIILSGDVLTSLALKDLIQFHEEKKSSFTFVLKEEEEKPKGKEKDKKKEENKEEEDLKLFLVNSDNRVVFAEGLSETEFVGVEVHNAVLRNVSQAKFHKVHDSHIYIIDQQVIK